MSVASKIEYNEVQRECRYIFGMADLQALSDVLRAELEALPVQYGHPGLATTSERPR